VQELLMRKKHRISLYLMSTRFHL